jgi:hypothetical protein
MRIQECSIEFLGELNYMRKFLVVLATVLVFSTVVFAQEATTVPPEMPKSELMIGYSFAHAGLQNDGLGSSAMSGGAAEYRRFINDNWAITADVTRLTHDNVQQSGVNAVRWSYLFGPTYAIRTPDSSVVPFAHVLFGYDHERFSIPYLNAGNPGDTYSTGLAFDLGGGLDIKVGDHIAARVAQVDYMRAAHGTGENAFRYTAGLVFKF